MSSKISHGVFSSITLEMQGKLQLDLILRMPCNSGLNLLKIL